MRKLIYAMSVSLDGYITDRHGALDWSGQPDKELFLFHTQRVEETGVHLCGRRLYEAMLYWQTAQPQLPEHVHFANVWNALSKVVFSTTLQSVTGNYRLLRDGVTEEVAKLKEQPGKDIGIGGAGLARSCINVIDEFRLFVHPIVLGGGTAFFPPLDKQIKLELLETKTFASRIVYVRYGRN